MYETICFPPLYTFESESRHGNFEEACCTSNYFCLDFSFRHFFWLGVVCLLTKMAIIIIVISVRSLERC
jgi:hypothetical protein